MSLQRNARRWLIFSRVPQQLLRAWFRAQEARTPSKNQGALSLEDELDRLENILREMIAELDDIPAKTPETAAIPTHIADMNAEKLKLANAARKASGRLGGRPPKKKEVK